MRKARKPKRMRSNKPTLSGNPPLMYLNSFFCPVCGRHLFSFYDGDLKRKDYLKIFFEADFQRIGRDPFVVTYSLDLFI